MDTFNGVLTESQRKRGKDVETARGIFRTEIYAGNHQRLTPNDADMMLTELYPEMVQG